MDPIDFLDLFSIPIDVDCIDYAFPYEDGSSLKRWREHSNSAYSDQEGIDDQNAKKSKDTTTGKESKETTMYLSAVMQEISKYVLEKAGKEKNPTGDDKCINFEDVEKVITSSGLKDFAKKDSYRDIYSGKLLCIDSMSKRKKESAIADVELVVSPYVETAVVNVSPSPFLKDFIINRPYMRDEIIFTSYCSSVVTCASLSPKAQCFCIIPGSIRLLLAITAARGKESQSIIKLLREYIKNAYVSVSFLMEIYIDSDDNDRFYNEYNEYRKDPTSMIPSKALASQLFYLETEQLVFYRLINDIYHGKWIVTIPRFCRVERWEYEQMMLRCSDKATKKCSIQINYQPNTLSTDACVLLGDRRAVLDKYNEIRQANYVSPWSNDNVNLLNQRVLINLGLLCLCPIEVIPVVYHYIYYQAAIVLYSPLPENHPAIKGIVDLITGDPI